MGLSKQRTSNLKNLNLRPVEKLPPTDTWRFFFNRGASRKTSECHGTSPERRTGAYELYVRILSEEQRRVKENIQVFKINAAASYSPTVLPLQYHQLRGTLLLCSGWEQVWPPRYRHRKVTALQIKRDICLNAHLTSLLLEVGSSRTKCTLRSASAVRLAAGAFWTPQKVLPHSPKQF